ncbi:hypothetical protein X798_00372 [Onchocerca flexuosa]|uniref:Uncharacterized protein n=1 Tax=Onchocerca flexuosa TaxID=387005 RepID=A0A238C5K8_9BILA|nr:hypothetical protein X798_00372 [Onchocerca flexuosa]
MLHVFNDPVEPGSLAEFQNAEDEDVAIKPVLLTEFENAKHEKTLFSCQTKRKITYHKDGRRFVGDKIENEQSASNLWSTALTRSVVRDLKDQSNEDPTSRNTGLKRYVSSLFQQLVQHCNVRITFGVIAVNIILILLIFYIFIF